MSGVAATLAASATINEGPADQGNLLELAGLQAAHQALT